MIDDKQKLLYLMRLLREETDPAHPMNAAQIYGSIVGKPEDARAFRKYVDQAIVVETRL